MNKKLSIIVPVFNSSNFIEKCMNSICKQLKKNTELILIDDCSTDNSIEVIKKYLLNFKFIKLIKLKKNLGAANARNIGIHLSEGENICFVDSDDKLISGAVSNILFNLEKNPNKDLYVLRNYITGRNKDENYLELNTIKNLKIGAKKKSLINFIFNFNSFRSICWNFIFKKKFLKKKSILFNSNLKISEDWPFVSKALCLSDSFTIIEKPTHLYQRLQPRTLGTTTGYIWVISNLKIIYDLNNFIKKEKKKLDTKKIKFLTTIIKRANYFVFTDILICSDKDIKKISKYIKKINSIIPNLTNLGLNGLNKFYKKNEKQIFLKLKYYNLKKNKVVEKKLHNFFKEEIILFCAGRSGSIASKILTNLDFRVSMFIDNNDNFSSSYIDGVKVNSFKYIENNFNKLKTSKIVICDNKKQVINSIKKQVKKIGFKKNDILAFDML